jgi:hypothetical protein
MKHDHARQVSAALETLLRKALLRPLPEVADESKAEAEAEAPAAAAAAADAAQVGPHLFTAAPNSAGTVVSPSHMLAGECCSSCSERHKVQMIRVSP